MNSWMKTMNRALKAHDSSLFCQETTPGRCDVYRKSGQTSHFIMALTDTWTPTGVPVPWGIEVVINRIKACDLWRNDRFVEDWIKEHEKIEESNGRSLRNSIESFFYDFRRQFAKATNEVNTSTLNKIYRKEGSKEYACY